MRILYCVCKHNNNYNIIITVWVIYTVKQSNITIILYVSASDKHSSIRYNSGNINEKSSVEIVYCTFRATSVFNNNNNVVKHPYIHTRVCIVHIDRMHMQDLIKFNKTVTQYCLLLLLCILCELKGEINSNITSSGHDKLWFRNELFLNCNSFALFRWILYL